ncbi:RadC family protein [Flavobacterium croceum]|uniref:DNA repair protein RadC n=1 Tax=Flavobacterium croceum DSM 17960 TaxID=1121886 RepID=A0A2S4NAF1_9FLAO|nr:DNA repair protein RadC [Flavobacterium croceum]POS02423.1 DNA repair protein RadC [Flavobacterium croceum DSM 17960]
MNLENNSFSIKNWAEDDKPREKLMLKGKESLSDAELVAILIGSGNKNESAVDLSKRILASVDNNLNKLGKLTLKQLMLFKGIGEAKAISIAAALELGRRRREEDTIELKKVTSSKAVFEIMQPIVGELPHEEFWVLYLNNANRVVYKSQIAKGGITSALVDVRLIFKTALEQSAVSIILVHNHPSGKLEASQEDKAITQKIKTVGNYMDIAVLDHIIITEKEYLSFQDEGIF